MSELIGFVLENLSRYLTPSTRGLTSVMRIAKNAVYNSENTFIQNVCELCLDNSKQKELEQLRLDVEFYRARYLELQVEQDNRISKNSCHKFIKKFFTDFQAHTIEENSTIKTVDALPYVAEDDMLCYKLTITFNPKAFPKNDNYYMSKRFILLILSNLFFNSPLAGCFEVHQSGICHAHLLLWNIKEMKITELIKIFNGTLKPYNEQTAINYKETTYKECYDYITKNETKEPSDKQPLFFNSIKKTVKKSIEISI